MKRFQKKQFKTILLSLFFGGLFYSQNVFSSSSIVNNGEISLNSSENKTIKSEYILDSGDVIFIDFIGLESYFSGNYPVNQNGNLYLPEIGFLSARGKTLKELKEILYREYEKIILNLEIELEMMNYRLLQIFIGGEVNNPGLYQIDYKRIISKGKFFTYKSPRIFDIIKKANGITNDADLSSIRIIRNNSKKYGGGKIEANVSLLALLNDGDQTQNIKLYDGDSIFIGKSNENTLEQILKINRTNLSPSKINVFVTGNVLKPGSVKVPQSSSLLTAISQAGGEKNLTGKIEFIRLKESGKTEKRIFKLNTNAKKGSPNNPFLIQGDIIVVRKNLLGKTTTSLKEITNPILSSYGLYKIFN